MAYAVDEQLAAVLDRGSAAGTPWPEGDLRVRLSASIQPAATRERWKYTPVAAFLDALPVAAIADPDLSGFEQSGIRVSRFSDAAATLGSGPGDAAAAPRFPLADAAALIAGDGLLVELSESPAAPLEISFGDGLHGPVLLRVREGVQATLIERNHASTFTNHALYVELDPGARLEHARVAFEPGCNDWTLTQVRLQAQARYSLDQHLTGGARRRSETLVLLEGRESHAELTGAYRVDSGTHLDQQVTLEHRSAGASSRQTFNGLGTGKGSATFNGRIHIHEQAPGSDAALSNRNLVLHPDAQINTKPELEIYTDDVRCAHGVTVGQPSDAALFYLQSRGVSAAQARLMLCRAFIRECIRGPLSDAATAALLDDLDAAGDTR